MRPGLFFDRDGTVIEHVDYLRDPNKIRFLPGAIEGLRRAQGAGFALVMISNQSGIGLGKMTIEDLVWVQMAFNRTLFSAGVALDRFYFSADPCGEGTTRKPSPHFVLVGARELEIDLRASSFIGDRCDDVYCGVNAGILPVLVRTGFGLETARKPEVQRVAAIASTFEEAVSAAMIRWRISLVEPGGRGSV
jgi:D-glycero-D-manno-heptose 1,7-bisphosphate phosphatase